MLTGSPGEGRCGYTDPPTPSPRAHARPVTVRLRCHLSPLLGEGLVNAFPEHHWQVLTLPDRYFSWRLRGNSLTWAMGDDRALLEQPWDRIIATSMVDLSALRGMVPALSQIPTCVYFHENQFAYPRSRQQTHSAVEPQLQSIYTALSADRLVFNTAYNRDTFLTGAAALLRKLPDHVPRGLIERITAQTRVVPVPLQEDVFEQASKSPALTQTQPPLTLAWAARWEYDKGPDRLLNIATALDQTGINFQLLVLGQSFRQRPEAFELLQNRLGHRLAHFGFAPSRNDYLHLLAQADIMLSTSEHEFQGVSVLEGVALGALPVLPNDQSYPCLFAPEWLYDTDMDAVARIHALAGQKCREGLPPSPDVTGFSWPALRQAYSEEVLLMEPAERLD